MLYEPSKDAFDISLQAGNMYFNRFCIDEEAGFEFSGVYPLDSKPLEDKVYTYRQFLEKAIEKNIESAFQKIAEDKVEDWEPHFIYAGRDLYGSINNLSNIYTEPYQLRSSLLKLMKKHQIKTVMFTLIYMEKEKLITKELMESYCKGEHGTPDCPRQMSINDDLEALFQDLQLGKEPTYKAITYYLPKLTENEMALVETKDQNYLRTFSASERTNNVTLYRNKTPYTGIIYPYDLPKLIENEKAIVGTKDENYLRSFSASEPSKSGAMTYDLPNLIENEKAMVKTKDQHYLFAFSASERTNDARNYDLYGMPVSTTRGKTRGIYNDIFYDHNFCNHDFCDHDFFDHDFCDQEERCDLEKCEKMSQSELQFILGKSHRRTFEIKL